MTDTVRGHELASVPIVTVPKATVAIGVVVRRATRANIGDLVQVGGQANSDSVLVATNDHNRILWFGV